MTIGADRATARSCLGASEERLAFFGKNVLEHGSIMKKRTTLSNSAMTTATVCTMIVACSSSSSKSPGTSVGSDSTPPGTTAVLAAPYPVCTTLTPGAFITADDAGASYTYPTSTACTSTASAAASGPADMHCQSEGNPNGTPPQPVNGQDCAVSPPASGDDASEATDAAMGDDAATGDDSGAGPTPGPCDENGTDGAYGSTNYGTEGDDDDCKYHVTYTASPICENTGTYFVVTATYQTAHPTVGAPLTGAATFAEVCYEGTQVDTISAAAEAHPVPAVDGRPPAGNQQVVEGPPGTYTIGPVVFDASGFWTVRFHFNEFCCDGADDSPHGHAAFHISVP